MLLQRIRNRRHLLASKADVFEKVTTDGLMPFALALERGHLDVAKLLMDRAVEQYHHQDRHKVYEYPSKTMQALDGILDWIIDRSSLPHGELVRTPKSPTEEVGGKGGSKAEHTLAGPLKSPGRGISNSIGSPRKECSVGEAPLTVHVAPHYVPFIKMLRSLGAGLDSPKGPGGGTRLHAAAREGNADLVESLCIGRADVNLMDLDSLTPLALALRATTATDTKLIATLLSFGADPSTQFPRGVHFGKVSPRWSPLHCAASKGLVGAVKLLLEFRADAGAYDDKGTTPLHLAVEKNHKSVVDCLIHFGRRSLNVNAIDKEGNTALDAAVMMVTGLPFAETLECAGGYHSIFWCIEQGDVDAIDDMADRGLIDLTQTNGEGQTPLQFAMEMPGSIGKAMVQMLSGVQQRLICSQ